MEHNYIQNTFSISNNHQIQNPKPQSKTIEIKRPSSKRKINPKNQVEYTIEKYGYLKNYGEKIITFKPKSTLQIEKNSIIQIQKPQLNKGDIESKKNSSHKSHLYFNDNTNSEPNLIFETGGIITYKNVSTITNIKNIENNNINDNNIVKTEPSPIYNKFTIETQNNYNYRNELSYSDLISEIIKYWKKNNIKVQNENFKIYAGPKLNFNINSQVIKLDKVNNCINNNILKNNRNDKDKNNKIDNVNKKEDFNDNEDDDENNSYIEINETKTTVTKKTKSKNKNNSSKLISSTINSKSTTNIINNNDSNKIKSIPQPLNNSTIINTNNIKKFNRIYPSYKVINLKFLGKSQNKKNENKSIIINSTSKIIIPQKFRNIYPSYRVSNIKILGKEKKSSFNKIRTSYRVINLKFLRNNNTDNKKTNVIENNRSKTPNRTLNNNIFKVNRVNNIKFLSKTPDKNLRKLGIRISYRVNNIKVIGKKAKKKFDFIIPKYRINTISFFPKNKFISSVKNFMAVKRIINLKFLSIPNYNKNKNNINENNLCNCKCHNSNSNLNNNSNIKKEENKEKNEKKEENEKSKKKLITVQRQFHFTLEPEPNDIIRQRSITYKIDSLFKPKIPINRITNEIFLDIISQTEKIRISKNPISFQTSNINFSFSGGSTLKNNVNVNKNFTRKISIFKPNWNFTNLISSEFFNFSIIDKNKNEDNIENNNNLKSDLKEKNNEELNNNLIKKKNIFNICNNYQIELKGNNKDENYDKIKLEIKCEKKNLDFEDFIQEDLFDKDNYYIFINNNKELYNFEYDNYPSFNEMKLKYNKFISSINENERNPYIIPRNIFLEIMKKIWNIENKENTLNLNIEYISKLNDNKSQNLMINIDNEKQNKNWLNHILVCPNQASIQINNDIKTLEEKKDEIINVDLLEIPNEKIYNITKLKWIKTSIPNNENNFSLININTFIDDNSLKTNENNNINKKIWYNLYIENTNFETLNNNIFNSNIIEVNDNKKIEKIKNENKLLKSKNLKTNEEIAKIKLDLMNSLNKSNEKNPPLTTKTKNKKDMEINNNKLHRSMTKPQKDNIKENINERIKNRINKNENQKKKKTN